MARKSFDNRLKDEKEEGYKTVETDLPSGRFQKSKQVLSPDELGITSSSIPGNDTLVTTSNVTVDKSKKLKSSIKIRPDVGVDELENKQVGGVPLAGSMMLRSVAGFSSVSPADDTSKTPYSGGNYRPDSRYGKKRSDDLFEMDNTISEQIVPIVEDSLDLKDSPDSKQGYNGRKQFKQTRSKKNFSFTNSDGTLLPKLPQQLLHESSVDFIETSKVVYSSGQIISGNIDAQANYPSQLYGGVDTNIVMQKSNYIPKSINIVVSRGKISSVSISEDMHNVSCDPISRDQANFNWQVDANNVAKSMIRMQTELGRETTDKWSPLGYVINQPYEYNMLQHDIESSTGAIMAAAYRSAVSSIAFQRNILAKDGINPQTNAIKMVYDGFGGVLANSCSDTFSDTQFSHVMFNKSIYRKGAVTGLIAMFDSIGKYRTKADILGMQRSLALHLSQADNNINPLHCKPSFIKALDKAHMFSTIDGNYNPMLPIFATKKIKLVNPLSLNVFLAGWKHPSEFTSADKNDPLRDQQTGTLANYAYEYVDIRNSYKTRVQHPIIEGLLRWLLKHEGAFANTFGDGTTVIPFEFNMQAPNLLSFILCSASQDVAWERNIIFRDILFAGEQVTYVWDDLIDMGKLNPLFSTQLTIGKYSEPLKLGKLANDTAIRELWNGQMQLSDVSGGKVQYFAPWYMNEHAFADASPAGSYTGNEGFFNESSAFNMSIPSIRDGVRHEYIDIVKGMSESDLRLCLDRMVTIPVFNEKTTVTTTIDNSTVTLFDQYDSVSVSGTLNDYIKLATLRYDSNSDGRLIIQYDLTSGSNRSMDHHSLMCVPHELGFIDDDLYGDKAITNISYDNDTSAVVITTTDLVPYTYLGLLSTAPAYNGYSPLTLVSYRVGANSNTSGGIDRSAALNQVLYRCFATSDANDLNTAYVAVTGIIPCFSYNDGLAIDVKGVYNLNSGFESDVEDADIQIRTNANRIWSLIQRFFLPVNRFENSFTLDSTDHAYDPLEGCFYFGVCGTLASDYTQHILERLDVYDQLGLDYTEDVFVKESQLFR